MSCLDLGKSIHKDFTTCYVLYVYVATLVTNDNDANDARWIID